MSLNCLSQKRGPVQAQTVVFHPVFEQQVLEALKQWRFARSDQEHRFQVTCYFEFANGCEGTTRHPITSETHISADLPKSVHIKTGLQCPEYPHRQQTQ
jgi:hypothetical protein